MESQALSKDEVVLTFLREHPQSKPLDVAKVLHAMDASVPKCRKSGNSILYRLQKEGKVRKEAEEDGTNPRWSLV